MLKINLILLAWASLLLSLSTASADDETIEECREHCTAAPHGKCYGTAGNELTIPCTGPTGSPLDPPYDYINITNDGVKEILLSNSSHLLTINLTSNHDNSRIYCESVASGSGSVIYQLSVCYAPIQVPLKDIPHSVGYGNYLKEKSLPCPLRSNPPMNCSWYLFRCLNIPPHELSRLYYGVEYTDNGCTIVIKELTHNYSNICFECNGTNLLGSNQGNYNSINFATCNQEPVMYVHNDDTGSEVENNSSLTVYTGDSVTFKCDLFGGSFFNKLYWYRDLNFSTWKYTENYTFDKYLCLCSGFIRLTNVTLDDSGFYTCSYGSQQYPIAITLFELNVREQSNLDTHNSSMDLLPIVIPPSLALGLGLIIIILAVAIIAASRIYVKRKRAQAQQHYAQLLVDDDFPDVYLWYVDEDATFANTCLKGPLENLGYTVHRQQFSNETESIKQLINENRFTIAVISSHFIKNERYRKIATAVLSDQTHQNYFLPVLIVDEARDDTKTIETAYHINSNDANLLDKITSTIYGRMSVVSQ